MRRGWNMTKVTVGCMFVWKTSQAHNRHTEREREKPFHRKKSDDEKRELENQENSWKECTCAALLMNSCLLLLANNSIQQLVKLMLRLSSLKQESTLKKARKKSEGWEERVNGKAEEEREDESQSCVTSVCFDSCSMSGVLFSLSFRCRNQRWATSMQCSRENEREREEMERRDKTWSERE